MTTIGLVRHGITEWNRLGKAQGVSDIPLNDLGRHQASSLANRLSAENQRWDVIISSDLSRAIETAQIIATQVKLPISFTDRRIREIDCGDIEGTTEEERIMKWGANWRTVEIGMEKYEDVATRGITFLKEIIHTYSGKRVLIISHGALIGITLQHLLPEQFQKTYIDNTSLTVLENRHGIWDCPLYNCTEHLS